MLVTTEDFPPVVEVDDTYPGSVNNDFHWLMKASFSLCLPLNALRDRFLFVCSDRTTDRLHVERRENAAPGYGAQLELGERPLSHQTSPGRRTVAGSLFFFFFFYSLLIRRGALPGKTTVAAIDSNCSFCVVSFLFFFQSALGLQDLGQLHYQPLKDSHGTLVISSTCHLANAKAVPSSLNFKWLPLSKLQRRVVTNDEATAGDLLLASLQVTIFLAHLPAVSLSRPLEALAAPG